MIIPKKKVSFVFTTICILRYVGLFPYAWQGAKSFFVFEGSLNGSPRGQKLVLHLYLYRYSLILFFSMFLFVIINTSEKIGIWLERGESVEGISFILTVSMIYSLYIVYWTIIIKNMNKLKKFINSNLILFQPTENNFDWVFTICVLIPFGFIVEESTRIAIYIFNGEVSPATFLLMIMLMDTLIRVGYILMFYSITFSLSKQWEILRLFNTVSNLELALKITKKIVRCQTKCNHLFTKAVTICLVLNIPSIIYHVFSLIINFTDNHYLQYEIKRIVIALLLTIMICDVSEKLNIQVSFTNLFFGICPNYLFKVKQIC